ncbi:MAG: sugar phosphate isomerase/epimerase, partial [PVC group bacterium]|nr:sugar phosphate isomerase/epimerase [PVC group bacterium]
AVENLPDNRGSWIADQLFNYFDKNEIDFCYDSSHENMSGGKFHLLKKHYSRLITCHLSDNNGTYDEHLVPGDGNIDWNQLVSYMEKAELFRDILFEVGTGEKLAVPVEDYIKRTSQKAFEIFKDDNN